MAVRVDAIYDRVVPTRGECRGQVPPHVHGHGLRFVIRDDRVVDFVLLVIDCLSWHDDLVGGGVEAVLSYRLTRCGNPHC